MPRLLADGANVGSHIPVAGGAESEGATNSQLHLTIVGHYGRRRVVGYVGDVPTDTQDAGTTAQNRLQIVAIAPWIYGGRPRVSGAYEPPARVRFLLGPRPPAHPHCSSE